MREIVFSDEIKYKIAKHHYCSTAKRVTVNKVFVLYENSG